MATMRAAQVARPGGPTLIAHQQERASAAGRGQSVALVDAHTEALPQLELLSP